jgi:hypothetical protein
MSSDPNKIPQPPYPKAPIAEGVIHLRIAGTATTDDQEKVVRRLSKDYPHSNPLQAFSLTINTTGGEVAVDQKPQGFRLTTDDQADVVLVFPDGIALPGLPRIKVGRSCGSAPRSPTRNGAVPPGISRYIESASDISIGLTFP